MRNIAKLPATDKRALFSNTASKIGLTVAIVEKDFWVCWTLDYLFHRCKWKDHFAFKGGTSLSKSFHLIERFSEDIDLILDWRVLGYGKDEPWEFRSKTKQDRFNKEANEKTACFLHNVFIPSIKSDISAELCQDVRIEQDSTDGLTVLFAFPQDFTEQSILQEIRLEIGALAVWTPAAQKEITPYSAEQYAHFFSEPTTSILTVLPERTFWEKATILHHEANRPSGNMIPARYSRHYYDMLCLSASWVKAKALADVGLLKRVAEFKHKFYPRSWAGYEYAVPGTIKLMPPQHCIKSLEMDYQHMQNMIFGAKLSFNEIMEGIQALEHEINTLI